MFSAHLPAALSVSAIVILTSWLYGVRGDDLLYVVFMIVSGQLSIGLSNNVFDARFDSLSGRTDKPIAAGNLSSFSVFGSALAFLAASIYFSLSLSPAGWLHIAALGFGWMYNLILKRTPFSVLCYIGAFALIPIFASSLATSLLPHLLIIVGFGGVGGGLHFVDALKDYEYDNRSGINGSPNSLSKPTAKTVQAMLLLFGFAALFIGILLETR